MGGIFEIGDISMMVGGWSTVVIVRIQLESDYPAALTIGRTSIHGMGPFVLSDSTHSYYNTLNAT